MTGHLGRIHCKDWQKVIGPEQLFSSSLYSLLSNTKRTYKSTNIFFQVKHRTKDE